MPDKKTSYEIADPFIAKFVRPLAAGDLARHFEGRDEHGRLLSLRDDHLSGKPLLLLFLNNVPPDRAVGALRVLGENSDRLRARDAAVLAIHSNGDAEVNQELKRQSGFPWPILGDPGGIIHAAYGLHKLHGPSIRVVLLSRYRQIQAWYDDPVDMHALLRSIMPQFTAPPIPEDSQWYPVHAPILMVPKVFTLEECDRIVQVFENSSELRVANEPAANPATDFKFPVYEHDRQDRIDLVIRDPGLVQLLGQRIGERVNPMIKKAFAFEVSRREDFHVARYTGTRGGIKMGHRDNTAPAVAYRRFAFSMNLNDGYEGGGITFREFNDHAYCPAPGTVLIFSSSLLHEVQETTHGIRYSLITHLFNDAALSALSAKADGGVR